jgi:hypothetical protein
MLELVQDLLILWPSYNKSLDAFRQLLHSDTIVAIIDATSTNVVHRHPQ